MPGKRNPQRQALDRIQEVIGRDTGRRLGAEGEAEIARILAGLAGAAEPQAGAPEAAGKEITILLADLRGFTAASAAWPTGRMIEALDAFLASMSDIVARHGGAIDRFDRLTGDSVTALFGASARREDDVRRALACALELQAAVERMNREQQDSGAVPEFALGLGVNTGDVPVATPGAQRDAELAAIGDGVRLDSRVEAFSLRGRVLIGERTWRRSIDFAETGAPIELQVRGSAEPVALRELLAVPSLGLRTPRPEARRSDRVEVSLPFTYKLVEHGRVRPHARVGTIRDLGYHGVLAELNHSLPIYAELRLSFALPRTDYRIVDARARVVNQKPADGAYLTGIEFTEVDAPTTSQIQRFVQSLIAAGPGEDRP